MKQLSIERENDYWPSPSQWQHQLQVRPCGSHFVTAILCSNIVARYYVPEHSKCPQQSSISHYTIKNHCNNFWSSEVRGALKTFRDTFPHMTFPKSFRWPVKKRIPHSVYRASVKSEIEECVLPFFKISFVGFDVKYINNNLREGRKIFIFIWENIYIFVFVSVSTAISVTSHLRHYEIILSPDLHKSVSY